MEEIRFIDLFAGIGGIRLGFGQACKELGINTRCVLTSEIKPFAIKALEDNFIHEKMLGDITEVSIDDIPEFDFLLAGFPCQPFSAGGLRLGFLDTRGTLFFEIERILKARKPYGFILENVEGLLTHDKENKSDKIGRTLKTILSSLKNLGYEVNHEVLDSKFFGLAQSRKRIYIVGTLKETISLEGFPIHKKVLKDVLESGLPVVNSKLTDLLLNRYKIEELYGKSIKDKRGGDNNIHSWDIGLKGEVTPIQSELMVKLFKERRKKHWAKRKGIEWMDGMPLTLDEISTFYPAPNLKELLDDLVDKGYLVLEHPKAMIKVQLDNGKYKKVRKKDPSIPIGYNIVAGKLSYEFSKILDPNNIVPTLVAADVSRLAVPDGKNLRRLTLREGLRLFGFPESYNLNVTETQGFDLLGNTVAIPVIKAISMRIADSYIRNVLLNKEDTLLEA